MTKTRNDHQQWVADIRAGKRTALQEVYKAYRGEFVGWLQHHYSCQEDDALDVFQESVIIMYKHIRSGKLESLSSSLKTYLFGIGKRVYFNKRKTTKHTLDVADQVRLEAEDHYGKKRELNDRQQVIVDLLKKLREPCKSILELFYYQQYGLEAIAQSLGYNSKDVAKAQKVRCMKRLRSVATKNYKKGDI